ncbi:siderophore-interacting protein [Salinicola rhizosphaerae]|uniref:Siderophore-interacting protein n=1 Tax=Salinicola rhizosphaerae TaxID=1443141 RepID=A0ABQ3DVZ5_9GAMM|nr:siderophore-interacting protein [Salinicola rhizosphaerae]GHB13726.1 siderophore-interacting protein [Salinicola rhizosphaerae]
MRLKSFLDEYDVAYTSGEQEMTVELPGGTAKFRSIRVGLHMEARGENRDDLETLRGIIEYYVSLFAGDNALPLHWHGDVVAAPTFANFREMRVTAVEDLSPSMRRLTLAGEDLSRFDQPDEWHVRLHLPPQGITQPQWPRPTAEGGTYWPPEDQRAEVRYYTIRRLDVARGEVEIDFLLHEAPGPGGDFARRARPGDLCGMAGPYGRGVAPASRYLLAGDETALPAISRLLETLPATATVEAWLEVESPVDELALSVPAHCRINWRHRCRGHAPSEQLASAVIEAMPAAREDLFVWFAGEAEVSQRLRKRLKKEFSLDKGQHLVTGYWKRESA